MHWAVGPKRKLLSRKLMVPRRVGSPGRLSKDRKDTPSKAPLQLGSEEAGLAPATGQSAMGSRGHRFAMHRMWIGMLRTSYPNHGCFRISI